MLIVWFERLKLGYATHLGAQLLRLLLAQRRLGCLAAGAGSARALVDAGSETVATLGAVHTERRAAGSGRLVRTHCSSACGHL